MKMVADFSGALDRLGLGPLSAMDIVHLSSLRFGNLEGYAVEATWIADHLDEVGQALAHPRPENRLCLVRLAMVLAISESMAETETGPEQPEDYRRIARGLRALANRFRPPS